MRFGNVMCSYTFHVHQCIIAPIYLLHGTSKVFISHILTVPQRFIIYVSIIIFSEIRT